MLRETIACLDPRPGQVIVDCTVGEGGHAAAFLERISPGGTLVGIDRDDEALARARDRTMNFSGSRVALARGSFSEVPALLAGLGLDRADAFLFDLGVSTRQLLDPARGFSFRGAGPLDMRMDRREARTAADLVNRLPVPDLERIIRDLGGERWAKRIARAIGWERSRGPIAGTTELAALIAHSVPGRGRIHPATRTFQALRITLNRELEELRKALPAAWSLLRAGGRICVISFHSLEDGIVKRTLRSWKQEGTAELLTKKPLRPSREEERSNPRSRSARLRAAVKKERETC
jgi:16S rRNA (cytosine1402-N4)-methyltransferase